MRPGCLQQRHVTTGRPSCPLGRASRREARACAALVENSTSAPSKPGSNGDGAPDIEGMVYFRCDVVVVAGTQAAVRAYVVWFRQHRLCAEPEKEFDDAYTIANLSLEQVCPDP